MKSNKFSFNWRVFIAVMSIFAVMILCTQSPSAYASDKVVGEVSTGTQIFGPNHTVGVIRFQDPKIPNAWCYLARAQTGGFAANFGMAEDPSEFTLDCFSKGVLKLPAGLPAKEEVSRTSRSAVFKEMIVQRFVDTEAQRVVYLVYTRKLWDGSPKNAMSSIPYEP